MVLNWDCNTCKSGSTQVTTKDNKIICVPIIDFCKIYEENGVKWDCGTCIDTYTQLSKSDHTQCVKAIDNCIDYETNGDCKTC